MGNVHMNETEGVAADPNELSNRTLVEVAELLDVFPEDVRFALGYYNELPVFGSVEEAEAAFNNAPETGGDENNDGLIFLSWLGLCSNFDELLNLYTGSRLKYHLRAHIEERLVSFCKDVAQTEKLFDLIDENRYANYLLGQRMVSLASEKSELFQIASGSTTGLSYELHCKAAEEKLLRLPLDKDELIQLLETASSVQTTKDAIQGLFFLVKAELEAELKAES